MISKEPELIHFPKIGDQRGNLTFLQSPDQLPFDIKRAYWVYDVPGGEIRGGHAFKKQHEVIIAISGSFDVVLDEGDKEQIFQLNRSYMGLHIPLKLINRLEGIKHNLDSNTNEQVNLSPILSTNNQA